jgi:phosphatidylglycerol lysyltransferase
MKNSPLRFGAVIRRSSFTLSLVFAILAVTTATGTLVNPIAPDQLARWGMSAADVAHGRLFPLLTAPFQVYRPYMVLSILAVTLAFVGACEWRLRTRMVAAVWIVSHVVGYVVGSAIILLFAHAGFAWATRLVSQPDVGASNGAIGAAGALMVFMPRRAQAFSVWLMLAYLVVAFLGEIHVWDLLHPVAFACGLGAGSLIYRHDVRAWPSLSRVIYLGHRERRRAASWIVGTIGLVDVLTPFATPDHPAFARLAQALPIDNPHWPRDLLFTLGAVLLMAAPPLSRGHRNAWALAVAALVLSTALQWNAGEPELQHILSLVLLLGLVAWRKDFGARGHRPSVRSGWKTLGTTAIIFVLYCAFGFYALRERFYPPFDVRGAVREAGARLAFEPPMPHTWHSPAAYWFLQSIPLLGWGGLVLASVRLLRATVAPGRAPGADVAAREILEQHGSSPTSFMTLWPGNAIQFVARGECYVAYRVTDHTAVTVGDPVGPPQRVEAAAREFIAFCDAHGWNPVFYSAARDHLDAYERLGFRHLQVGEDAVIPLDQLEFTGKEWQNVRSAHNRANREGVTFHLYSGGNVPAALRAQIDEISRDWTDSKGLPELEFTLGRTQDVDDPNVEVSLAVGADGKVHAFADWLPVYGPRAWVIDLMRRREQAMPGVMEFMIASALIRFRDRGYDAVSLGVAPLADVDRDEDTSLIARVLSTVYERFDAVYRFKSLFEFKARFQPEWRPMFLVYRDPVQLPAIGLAIVRAHMPGVDAGHIAKLAGEALARRLGRDDADRDPDSQS